MTADALAADVIARLRALARPKRAAAVAAETPTAQACLGLPVGDVRSVVKACKARVRALAPDEALQFALAVIGDGTLDGRHCAYELLESHRAAMAALTTRAVERLGRGSTTGTAWTSSPAASAAPSGARGA